jgi:anti-anti-sigma factor
MNPHNLSAFPSGAITRSGTDKSDKKKLELTLAVGYPGSAVVLHCEGRTIFHNEAQGLSKVVIEVLPTAHRMILDLASVESIDSGALGELVLTHMWAEAAGYTLRFASPQKALRQLFESTNLVSVFDVYPTVADAMAAMVQEEVREIHSA